MHITGTKTPFDFLTAIAKHKLEGILQNVKQDILLTEGEQDHLFNADWVYSTMRELVCARSVTARIFTAREGGEQHCQVGNSALAGKRSSIGSPVSTPASGAMPPPRLQNGRTQPDRPLKVRAIFFRQTTR